MAAVSAPAFYIVWRAPQHAPACDAPSRPMAPIVVIADGPARVRRETL